MKIIALYLLITSFIGLIFGIINRIKTGEREIIGYTAFMPFLLLKLSFYIRIFSQKNLYLHKPNLEMTLKFKDCRFFKIHEEYKIGEIEYCKTKCYSIISKRFNIFFDISYNIGDYSRIIYKQDLLKGDDLESLFHSLKATTKFNL